MSKRDDGATAMRAAAAALCREYAAECFAMAKATEHNVLASSRDSRGRAALLLATEIEALPLGQGCSTAEIKKLRDAWQAAKKARELLPAVSRRWFAAGRAETAALEAYQRAMNAGGRRD